MVTKKQIAALKYMIFVSRNDNELSKRILAFLIDKSEKLTKEVCITLVADREGYTASEIENAAHAIGGMNSSSGTTHLHALLCLMGGKFSFSHHYGDVDPTRIGNIFNNDGQFAGFAVSQVRSPNLAIEGMPTRYTFWFSKKDYSRQALYVVATRDILEKINIKKSGLYTSLDC